MMGLLSLASLLLIGTPVPPEKYDRKTMNRRSVISIALCWLLAVAALGCTSDDSTAPSTTKAPGGRNQSGQGSSSTTPPAAPSAGCRADRLAPGRTEMTVRSGGHDRTYIRYVPEGLATGEPAPLVVDFPAYSPASLEESFSGFTKPDQAGKVKADEVGAVVVTPEPVNGAGALLTWNFVGTPGWTDDQQFVTDLLDHVEATACIDPDRVLAMGFAIGAVFASITACEQAERFAALATVSGLYSPAGCKPTKAVPVLSFHGTGDRFIPFDGSVGSGAAGLGLSPETTSGLIFMTSREGARASSAAWADHGGCRTQPEVEPVVDGVTREVWSDCEVASTVELYVIEGGEHTWPGSNGMAAFEGLLGPVSHDIVANDVIWDFFERATS